MPAVRMEPKRLLILSFVVALVHALLHRAQCDPMDTLTWTEKP